MRPDLKSEAEKQREILERMARALEELAAIEKRREARIRGW